MKIGCYLSKSINLQDHDWCVIRVRGPYDNPDIGSSEFTDDSVAAYTHALAWCLTGETAHAKIVIRILNGWSETLQKIAGHDTLLLIGMAGIRFCTAAEFIRHSNSGWPKAGQERFEQMLRQIFYPPIRRISSPRPMAIGMRP